jgi:hypothetical protein
VRSPLGEWHDAAPAGRYSAKADELRPGGHEHTSECSQRSTPAGYSGPPEKVGQCHHGAVAQVGLDRALDALDVAYQQVTEVVSGLGEAELMPR